MTTGPQDPAASRDRLRAGHADREHAIEALKTAFVDGRLTKSELAARTGRALAARTYADLAALTADIPAEPTPAEPTPAEPTPAEPTRAEPTPARPAAVVNVPAEPAAVVPGPARPPAPPVRRPLAKAAALSGVCLVVVAAARQLNDHFDPGGPGPNPDHSWGALCFLVALIALMTALGIMGVGVVISIEQRRSGRKPPRPGPGGLALDAERRDGTSQDQVLPGSRTDQTRTDLRADKSRRRERRIPTRAGRAPGGVSPAPGTT